MAEVFDISRVNANPARFDLKKCTAINGEWMRALETDDLTDRLIPYLVTDGVFSQHPTQDQVLTLRKAVPLVQERMETLRQGVGMLGFLFYGESGSPEFQVEPAEAEKVLTQDAQPVLTAGLQALGQLEEWTTETIEAALREALIDGLELKPKLAFGPIREAVNGRRITPPLFESLEILGRERTLARLEAALG